MPTYDYRCSNCGHQFETVQKFSDEPLKICPVCGHAELRKVFHPAGVVFKGSGWYINDSRSKDKRSEPVKAENSSNSSSSEPAKVEAKADSATTTTTSSEAPKTETKTKSADAPAA
jgi:putative FmdB family regulatory protein